MDDIGEKGHGEYMIEFGHESKNPHAVNLLMIQVLSNHCDIIQLLLWLLTIANCHGISNGKQSTI